MKEVNRGDVVFLSTDMVLSAPQRDALHDVLKSVSDDLGVKIVLLECGLKIEGIIRS